MIVMKLSKRKIESNKKREKTIDAFLKSGGNLSTEELGNKLNINRATAGYYLDHYFKNKALYRRKVERYSKSKVNV